MQVPHWHIKRAVQTLHAGGVIAYPTEAVWGLGCDPFNEQAVMRLLDLKQRPWHKGLILVVANTRQLGPLFDALPTEQQQRLQTPTAYPTTWLLPDPQHLVPQWVKGVHSPVAVRISQHPQVQQLCRAYDGMLVSTSANRSSQPAARSLPALRRSFNMARVGMTKQTALDFILPGALGGYEQPSEIRDLVTGEILRTAS